MNAKSAVGLPGFLGICWIAGGLLSALMLAGGCSPSLAIRAWQPGPVNLGATNELVLVGGEGRRSARETVYNELPSQARTTGYYKIIDRSEEGGEAQISGRNVTVAGGLASASRG